MNRKKKKEKGRVKWKGREDEIRNMVGREEGREQGKKGRRKKGRRERHSITENRRSIKVQKILCRGDKVKPRAH